MSEIAEKTWEELDKIESKLQFTQFLTALNDIIKKKREEIGIEGNRESVEDLEKCFRLLQKEFLIDCLKNQPDNREQRDTKHIKRDIRNVFRLENTNRIGTRNALIFGAGISMDPPFNLPNWSVLLQRIHKNYFLECYGSNISDIDIKKTLSTTDLYEMAQYLESILSEEYMQEYGEEFRIGTYNRLFQMLSDALYAKGPTKEELESKSEGSKIGYFAKLAYKHKIQRILTYNYDDFFEKVYSILYSPKKIAPIFVDEQLPYANELKKKQVYHVHGLIPKYYDYNQEFLPKKPYENWLHSAEARHIVLTENSYDEIARSNYKWRNTVQADTLVRYNCFIFGFSATDQNFKRLTKLIDWHQNEISGQLISQPVKHYIFLTIDSYLKDIFHECVNSEINNSSMPTNLLTLQKTDGTEYNVETLVAKIQFLYYILRSKRKYLRRFHIYPIWTTIEDLTQRVQSIIGE